MIAPASVNSSWKPSPGRVVGREWIVVRAGLRPWPKLFQNLRANRETELAAAFPIHVVCEWMGNSPKIVARHYLRVTAADCERAAGAAHQVAPLWHKRWLCTRMHLGQSACSRP